VAVDEKGTVTLSKNFGTAAQQSGAGCGNIKPIGITGTPAIDAASRTIYFDTAVADGNGNIAKHLIHAVSIDTGVEHSAGGR